MRSILAHRASPQHTSSTIPHIGCTVPRISSTFRADHGCLHAARRSATSERHFGAPLRRATSESHFGEPSVPLATRRSSPHAGTPPSSGANAASWQTASRGLMPPSASSAMRLAHWLLRTMWPLPAPFVVIISARRRSCKSSGTLKNHNSLIIYTIEISSVADGINLASSGTP